MRSTNPKDLCDPCSKPILSADDRAEIFERISEMTDVRARRKAFEALADLEAERAEAAA